MARKTKAEAERTRVLILKTTLDLFLKKGYEGTTFVDIADRIKLSKGAVYWHFKSKPELLMALMDYMHEKHQDAVKEFQDVGSLEALRDSCVAKAATILKDVECINFMRVMMTLDWSAKRNVALKKMLLRRDKGLHGTITETLAALQKTGEVKPDADVKTAAIVLTAIWLGMLRIKLDLGHEVDLPKAIGFGFDMAISNIRAPKAPKHKVGKK